MKNLHTNKPYYIVPLLIIQPTWGGSYIAKTKSIDDEKVTNAKIGQSYELAGETVLTTEPGKKPAYMLAEATDIENPSHFHDSEKGFALSDLIQQNPSDVLGDKVIEKHGEKMPLLIKFTQARNNSYQLHVQPDKKFGKWQPKPESWFYFERGKVTLGIKPETDLAEYQRLCHDIDQKAQEISAQIKSSEINLEDGKKQLMLYIANRHPGQFVNIVHTKPGEVIDLSGGGLHHSWENEPGLPRGNIVYEVQLDQKDDASTIRCFDQGSIKDDGSVRPIQIDDYFKALNTDPDYNQPETHMQSVAEQEENGARIKALFTNNHYHLTQISFQGTYSGEESRLKDQFHHLYVRSGSITLETDKGSYPLSAGWSLFVPAAVGHYSLKSNGPSEVLKTFV